MKGRRGYNNQLDWYHARIALHNESAHAPFEVNHRFSDFTVMATSSVMMMMMKMPEQKKKKKFCQAFCHTAILPWAPGFLPQTVGGWVVGGDATSSQCPSKKCRAFAMRALLVARDEIL